MEWVVCSFFCICYYMYCRCWKYSCHVSHVATSNATSKSNESSSTAASPIRQPMPTESAYVRYVLTSPLPPTEHSKIPYFINIVRINPLSFFHPTTLFTLKNRGYSRVTGQRFMLNLKMAICPKKYPSDPASHHLAKTEEFQKLSSHLTTNLNIYDRSVFSILD